MDPAPPHSLWRALYEEAFDRYGVRALWSLRRAPNPKPTDALAVGRGLRVAGDMDARRLAERLEAASRAAD